MKHFFRLAKYDKEEGSVSFVDNVDLANYDTLEIGPIGFGILPNSNRWDILCVLRDIWDFFQVIVRAIFNPW